MSSETTQYRLKVTAGPSYDPSTHVQVPVNADKTLRISNEHADTNLAVRIQNYTGYPPTSPRTNPYFTHPSHSKDQYSISFAILFKQLSGINGNDIVFGNDFDNPIRDRLPPGFNAALKLAQWTIDPALDGDAYADKPYLYSPALATWNRFRVGSLKKGDQGDLPDVHDLVVEEGEDEDGDGLREIHGITNTIDGRRSHFQSEENRKAWTFEKGRVYYADFGNQYLDFNEFTLRLPGFNINALQYIDEKTHSLRYVLKNRASGEVYLVVVFTLVHATEQDNDQGQDKVKSNSKRFEWEEPSAGDVE
ncbi:DUF1769 domain-containing protein [Aspergillus undulatus]|uniref:DUF1769 domain-containing protein n=1 Tax=Aspergillus undulatus TaxID=1810928 RepID=UPI003CCD2985